MKTIWTSNGELDNLMNMPIEDKRQKLLDFGYDQEMVNGLETEQEVDDVLSEEPLIYDGAAMDFEEEIAPMLANQFFEGLILDEQFNLVDPAELLNFDGYSAELYEDDNGDLYWQTEGRKAFPILGFSDNPEGMITQLGELEILDSLHNLYPEHEDVDFLDRYYFEDFIPRDWNTLTDVLTHAKNESKLGECAEQDLTEAKAKNPIKLEAELEEIKDLAEEYGYEYLLQSPFVNYDNDPISIEYQYPEFARVVKSFFKEMGLDMEDLDLQWDSLDKHDWDTIIKVCDKLVTGKGVQFEKEYKTGYNSVLDEPEAEEESLNEDVKSQGQKNAEAFLQYLNDHDVKSGAFSERDPELTRGHGETDYYEVSLYSQGGSLEVYFNDDGSIRWHEEFDEDNVAPGDDTLVIEDFDNWNDMVLWMRDDHFFWSEDGGRDLKTWDDYGAFGHGSFDSGYTIEPNFDESLNEKFSASLAGEHKGSLEDKFGEGCKDEYYGYIGIDHPTLGEFTISVGIDGDVRTDGRPWEFLQKDEYRLTPEQAEFVMKHKNKFAEMVKNDIPNKTFREDINEFDESLNEEWVERDDVSDALIYKTDDGKYTATFRSKTYTEDKLDDLKQDLHDAYNAYYGMVDDYYTKRRAISDEEIAKLYAKKDESLNEDAAEELAMHELKEEVANYIYEFYLANVDDNIAQSVHASIPQYDTNWCNEEGDNFVANGVDQMKHAFARKIADALFANAPRELGESLVEGPQDNNKEIEDVMWDAISNAAYNLEVEKEIHLDKEVFRNIVNKVIDRFMVDDEFDESLNEGLSHDAKKVIFDTFEYYDDGEGWDPSGYTVLFNDIVNNANDIVKKELLSKKQEVMSYIDKLASYEFDGPTYEFDALNYDTSLNEADGNDWPWGDPKTTLPKKKEPAEDTSLDNLID